MRQFLFRVCFEDSLEFSRPLPCFVLVEERFWKEERQLDDEELGDLDGRLSDQWDEIMAGIYYFWEYSPEDNYLALNSERGRQELLSLGLKEIPDQEWNSELFPL